MATEQNRSTQRSIWRSAVALGSIAVVGTALLAGVNQLTRDRIAAQERRAVLQQLEQLIAAERHDNSLQDDTYDFTDTTSFPGNSSVTVYRARMQGQPVAAVFRLSAMNGYNGEISLLVGVNRDASLSGVRVTSHKETPGLGDAIETTKSAWIYGFSGRSLVNPQPQGWTVKRDGGVFDQFTGATITPRAIVKAVQRTLEYYVAHRELIFDHAASFSEPGSDEDS